MAKFLATYLVVTGIGAFLALAMPWLVVIGFFLLIIPGLLLSFSPTAFLWGCVFAASWWLCRSAMGEWVAVVPALAITAAVLIAIPAPSRQAGQTIFQASLLPEVTPEAPLTPAGDIRLDLITPKWDKSSRDDRGRVDAIGCDNLCLALLFTPGVTSVTVNRTRDYSAEEHRDGGGALIEGARTFRLRPSGECGERALPFEPDDVMDPFSRTLEEKRRVASEWNLRLATDLCIVADPPLTRFDMRIREGRYVLPEGAERLPSNWSLAHGPAQVSYTEVTDGDGAVLLRRLISKVAVPARVLHIAPSGGIENFRFHWGRETLSNAARYAEFSLVEMLAEQTVLGAGTASQDLVPRIRAQLKEALANPARPAEDPVFATLETYFDGIKDEPLGEEDLALVTALVLDDRLIRYRGFWLLEKLPADQHRQIGAAIVLRMLATKDARALRRTPFSQFLASSPQGAFASLSEDEQVLLGAPDRRIAAKGLVARLSDRGGAAVPMLLDILRHHAAGWKQARENGRTSPERSSIVEGHSDMVSGARIALCRLGPEAAGALAPVEAMIADGTIPPFLLEGHGGTDWNLTLLRLGKPMDEIRKPDRLSGSEENYRRNMQDRLRRFDSERSCGRV